MRQGDYNLSHNILKLYNVLIQTRLATSKTKRESSIANMVHELLPLGGQNAHTRKKKFGWRHSLVPSPLSRNSTLAVAVKKHSKIDIKLFLSCPALLDFSISFQIFCPG